MCWVSSKKNHHQVAMERVKLLRPHIKVYDVVSGCLYFKIYMHIYYVYFRICKLVIRAAFSFVLCCSIHFLRYALLTMKYKYYDYLVILYVKLCVYRFIGTKPVKQVFFYRSNIK